MKCIKTLVFFAIEFLLLNSVGYSQNEIPDSTVLHRRFRSERFEMAKLLPEKADEYFTNAAEQFMNKGDTVDYLFCIVHLSDLEHRKGQFNEAFDLLWDALPMAEVVSENKPLIKIHHMLGILYGIYDKDSLALSHTMQAHNLAIQNPQRFKNYWLALVSSYLDVAVRYLEMEDYKTALIYLDSCYRVSEQKERLHYVDGIYGQVYLELGDYKKAEIYLDGVVDYLENIGSGFQTSIYYFLAEVEKQKRNYSKAIGFYEKSLIAIDSLQANLRLKPTVLENQALVFSEIGESRKAFLAMQQAKAISDSLFNTQSRQNNALFEIKNRYKEDLVLKEEKIRSQNELLSVNAKAQFRLKLLIGILVLLTIIGTITGWLIYKMKRMAYQQAVNKEKNDAILEVKNKELTTDALQIIEKEQIVKELMSVIAEKDPDNYNKLSRKYNRNSNRIWDDFNLRFTQINDTFYGRLLELHPTLTSTDLKHCALMKLNFDSKEMSHLLGISINSVHMARSRIRKKLNLSRNESLSGYLAKV